MIYTIPKIEGFPLITIREYLKVKGLDLSQNITISYAMKKGVLDVALPEKVVGGLDENYQNSYGNALIVYNEKAREYEPREYSKTDSESEGEKKPIKARKKYKSIDKRTNHIQNNLLASLGDIKDNRIASIGYKGKFQYEVKEGEAIRISPTKKTAYIIDKDGMAIESISASKIDWLKDREGKEINFIAL
jgi:hypothetical protein